MKTKILIAVMVVVGMLGFISCGGGGGGAVTGVQGIITDMNNVPLKDVEVYSGTTTTATNAAGAYTLSINAGDKSVSARLANYVLTTKIVTVVANAYAEQDMKLVKVSTTATFDAGAGKTVNDAGAEVVFPKDAYKLADGSKYIGEVTVGVTYNRVTTEKGAEAFPGNFLGQEASGDTKVLQSYGFIAVDLRSADGKALDLDGAKATIKYPWDPADGVKVDGDIIPLWHFDVDSGTWKEEGQATYDAASGMFIGEVGHFSTWNLDAKSGGGTIRGCVQDANGAVSTKALVYVRTAGWHKTIVNNDSTGCFELINAPSGTAVSIQAMYGEKMSAEKVNTLTAGAIWDLGVMKLDQASASQLVEVKGRLVDVNGSAVGWGIFVPIPNNTGYDDECFMEHGVGTGYFDCAFVRGAYTGITVSSGTFEANYTLETQQSLTDLGNVIVK